MAVNVGSADRLIRIILGVALIVLPFLTHWDLWTNPMARFGLPVIGVVLVVTALTRFCPLYRLVGLRTCKI